MSGLPDDHTELLQEQVLKKRFPEFSTIYPDVTLYKNGRRLAQYDVLAVRLLEFFQGHQKAAYGEWRALDLARERGEFPTLEGLPGKFMYGEASNTFKTVHDFLVKFEHMGWRPFEALLMVDKVVIDSTEFKPSSLAMQIQHLMSYEPIKGTEAPTVDHLALIPNVSMVTLLVAGRIEFRKTNPATNTASNELHNRSTNRRKHLERELQDEQVKRQRLESERDEERVETYRREKLAEEALKQEKEENKQLREQLKAFQQQQQQVQQPK